MVSVIFSVLLSFQISLDPAILLLSQNSVFYFLSPFMFLEYALNVTICKTDERSSSMLYIGLRHQLGSNICRTTFILTAAWCSAHHFLPSCCSSGFLGSGPEAFQLAGGVDLWFCCSVSSAALATFYSLYLFSLNSSNSYTVCSSLQNWIFQHGINEQGFDLTLDLCRPVYPPGVRYRFHKDFLTTLNCSILHTICCFYKK